MALVSVLSLFVVQVGVVVDRGVNISTWIVFSRTDKVTIRENLSSLNWFVFGLLLSLKWSIFVTPKEV